MGVGNWSPIARALNLELGKNELNGRIGKQCRERWNHHLMPDIKKVKDRGHVQIGLVTTSAESHIGEYNLKWCICRIRFICLSVCKLQTQLNVVIWHTYFMLHRRAKNKINFLLTFIPPLCFMSLGALVSE